MVDHGYGSAELRVRGAQMVLRIAAACLFSLAAVSLLWSPLPPQLPTGHERVWVLLDIGVSTSVLVIIGLMIAACWCIRGAVSVRTWLGSVLGLAGAAAALALLGLVRCFLSSVAFGWGDEDYDFDSVLRRHLSWSRTAFAALTMATGAAAMLCGLIRPATGRPRTF